MSAARYNQLAPLFWMVTGNYSQRLALKASEHCAASNCPLSSIGLRKLLIAPLPREQQWLRPLPNSEIVLPPPPHRLFLGSIFHPLPPFFAFLYTASPDSCFFSPTLHLHLQPQLRLHQQIEPTQYWHLTPTSTCLWLCGCVQAPSDTQHQRFMQPTQFHPRTHIHTRIAILIVSSQLHTFHRPATLSLSIPV